LQRGAGNLFSRLPLARRVAAIKGGQEPRERDARANPFLNTGVAVLQARIGLLAGVALALAGCQGPPKPPPPPPPPPLPPHIGPPPAAACTVAPFHVADGGTTDVVMSVGNDGGYCAATLTDAAGAPFDAPLVPVLPEHGTPRVVKYNGKTSVEYTPAPGYVGHDSFVVHLLLKGQAGHTTLNMSVDVKPAGGGKV
jgi:hypothetical protein